MVRVLVIQGGTFAFLYLMAMIVCKFRGRD